MYHTHHTTTPKSNPIKVLVAITALSASLTAANYFNSDSGVRENRRASRNSYCNFIENRAIAIERRNDCGTFNRAACCNLLERQARKLSMGRRNGNTACGISSFFSDLCNRPR